MVTTTTQYNTIHHQKISIDLYKHEEEKVWSCLFAKLCNALSCKKECTMNCTIRRTSLYNMRGRSLYKKRRVPAQGVFHHSPGAPLPCTHSTGQQSLHLFASPSSSSSSSPLYIYHHRHHHHHHHHHHHRNLIGET